MQPLDWIMYLYLIYAGVYILLFVLFDYYWNKPLPEMAVGVYFPTVSLLIPVRNEENQLAGLFESIHALNYPKLQVIFTNDFSEDESINRLEAAVSAARAAGKDWHLLNGLQPGKKAAQTIAVLAATGEIIISTDADCRFRPEWITQLTAPFADPSILLVAGPVMTLPISSPTFSGFQQIEWSSILLVTQLAFGLGKPFMCSGANMAYRRAAFLELKGYAGNTHLLSGDDEFLLKKILRKYGAEATRYLPQGEVLVMTAAQENWSQLFTQRARWASKWTAHKSFSHLIIALVPFVMQLLFILSPWLLFHGQTGAFIFLLFWAAKIWVERWVVGSLLTGFELKLTIWAFVTTSFIHPLYALGTAINVVKSDWEWKGRRQSTPPKL